jgi:hypothetical protein
MLFTFRSKACAEFYMLGSHAAILLDLIGKPAAATGIITTEQLPEAIAAIEAAIGRAPAPTPPDDDEGVRDLPRDVGLAQRAWPLLDMLRKARSKGADVIWESR